MYKKSAGISIIEAALAIGLIAIVSIGVLSILGSNINTMFSKSEKSFEGYKPFNWATPGNAGVPSGKLPNDSPIVTGESITGGSNNSSDNIGNIGTYDPAETAGSAGTENTTAYTSSTGNASNNSSQEEDDLNITYGSGTRTFTDNSPPDGSGSSTLVGVDTSGIQGKANINPVLNGSGISSPPTGF